MPIQINSKPSKSNELIFLGLRTEFGLFFPYQFKVEGGTAFLVQCWLLACCYPTVLISGTAEMLASDLKRMCQ